MGARLRAVLPQAIVVNALDHDHLASKGCEVSRQIADAEDRRAGLWAPTPRDHEKQQCDETAHTMLKIPPWRMKFP